MVDPTRVPRPGPADPSLHILFLDPALRDGSGVGTTRTHDLAARLVAGGHRVTVLTTTQGWAPPHPMTTRTMTCTLANGVAVRVLRVPAATTWDMTATNRGRYARWAMGAMWRVAEVDMVMAAADPYWLMPFVAFFAWWRAVPLIADVCDLPPDPPPADAPRRTRVAAALARWGRRMTLRLPCRIFAPSQAVADALGAMGVASEHIIQTMLGCDVPLFTFAAGRDNGFLRDFPDLAGRPLLVFAGRFTADRDLVAVVNLAAALRDWAPDVAVVLCGDGPGRAQIEAHARTIGVLDSTVRLLAPLPRNRLPDLMAAATMVISLPRRNDTAGGFFDALAAGRPLLAFGDSWQRSLVESRGAGFGLPAGDASSVAREVVEILRDSDGLRRAGQQAAALAAGRFNADRILGEQRTVVEDVVAAAPRADILRRRTLNAKRVFDIVGAAALLLLLSPLLLVLAIVVWIKLGGPPLVTAARAGLKGRTFRSLRFRTLTDAEDSAGALLSDDARRTAFGDALKAGGLAALPELANVVRGTMSFVGPQPLPPSYLAHYTPAQRRRHDLRPGLTGLAQVDARKTVSWEDVFARDVAYVDNVSLGGDARIIGKALLNLVRGKRAAGSTLPAFDDVMARREGAEDV